MSFSKYAKSILIVGVVLCVGSTLPANAQYNNYSNNNQTNANNQNNTNQSGNSGFGNQLGKSGSTGSQNRSSRSRSSRSRSRDASTQNAVGGGQATAGPTAKRPSSVRPGAARPGAARPKPASGSSSAGNAKGRTYLGSTKSLVTTKPTATFYLNSDSPVGVINEPKVIKVMMSNKAQLKFDRISFVIKYNPDDVIISTGKDASGTLVKAESISLTPSPTLDMQVDSKMKKSKAYSLVFGNKSKLDIIENTIDAENGLISLDIQAKKDPIAWNGLIAQFTCIPLHEAQTNISFLFINPEKRDAAKEPLTSLSLFKKDQLGTRFSAADGVVNLDMHIFENRDMAKKSSIITKKGDDLLEDSSAEAASLVLIPREKQVSVGDIMEIDVCLKNPGKTVFDSIGLLIAYNTRVFEPVDGEEAVSGINIQDKKYKSNFSMDFPLLNVIDEEKGIIDYRKKAMRKPVSSEGVFATVRLRAIKPTKKTTFRMFISSKGEEPTTGVSYRSQDRLGNPSDPFDGVETCSVGVNPTTAYLSKLN
jgi:hypothetical protein